MPSTDGWVPSWSRSKNLIALVETVRINPNKVRLEYSRIFRMNHKGSTMINGHFKQIQVYDLPTFVPLNLHPHQARALFGACAGSADAPGSQRRFCIPKKRHEQCRKMSKT
jgi:hypothetical protein